jgi:hypothetical protein
MPVNLEQNRLELVTNVTKRMTEQKQDIGVVMLPDMLKNWVLNQVEVGNG